ncbi:MAG TPA: hypothetical protein VHM25_08045, partial [Polyangiaceae bacterium]|nr:hypothetical protein [Polyangiaceae bacterium]
MHAPAELGAQARSAALRIGQWLSLGTVVGVLCGAASAVFLLSLERATEYRSSHELLVYALPIAGIVVGLIYERLGSKIAGGNN